MHAHKRFTVATDVQVYFCDPRSPWQRGSNENTNGLLRQYFPRGTDFSRISQSYLNAIALRLNQRPRKTLGFQRQPIDYKRCCTDRLNAQSKSSDPIGSAAADLEPGCISGDSVVRLALAERRRPRCGIGLGGSFSRVRVRKEREVNATRLGHLDGMVSICSGHAATVGYAGL